MNRRDISNASAPNVAVDFDALLLYPSMEHQVKIRRLEHWNWLRRRAEPMVLRWHPPSHEAEVFAYWLVEQFGLNLTVIVRRKYVGHFLWYGNLLDAVHHVLRDFPSERFHLVEAEELADQAVAVNSYCRTHSILRLLTGDEALARCLPSSLVKLVTNWDETLVML